MKVGELKQQIADAGGKLQISDLDFVHKVDDDIDIKNNSNLIGWISKDVEDTEDAADCLSTISGKTGLEKLAVLTQLAQFFGIHVDGIKPIEVPREVIKEVPMEDMEKHKLAGKVEAYENIHIGRSITAS